jgi:hypothetical protein
MCYCTRVLLVVLLVSLSGPVCAQDETDAAREQRERAAGAGVLFYTKTVHEHRQACQALYPEMTAALEASHNAWFKTNVELYTLAYGALIFVQPELVKKTIPEQAKAFIREYLSKIPDHKRQGTCLAFKNNLLLGVHDIATIHPDDTAVLRQMRDRLGILPWTQQ